MIPLEKRALRSSYRNIGRSQDYTISWFSKLYGNDWSEWQHLACEYLKYRNNDRDITSSQSLKCVRGNLVWFLEHYLWYEGFPSEPKELFTYVNCVPDLTKAIARSNRLNQEYRLIRHSDIYKFIDWIIASKRIVSNSPNTKNPFVFRGRNDGRSSDVKFTWLILRHGSEWETWRSYAEKWLLKLKGNITPHMLSLSWFFEKYLIKHGIGPDPLSLFSPTSPLVDISICIRGLNLTSNERNRRNNICKSFLDWVILQDFSEPDDKGKPIPIFENPLPKLRQNAASRSESVYNPLPYTYIKELREILCPRNADSFNQWEWAQSAWSRSDWFEVDSNIVDSHNPDCVFRTSIKSVGSESIEITEMWSPVRAVALLIKLHLPLRSYQVRMLDSGESDTWRFKANKWEENKRHDFKLGSIKSPWRKGVFRRTPVPELGHVMTGLYINTNKTADQNKDEIDRGYTIPWENTEVLFWLEKLRDWQELFNPITRPTKWSDLTSHHIGHTKSIKTLRQMGHCCFLFRDRSVNSEDQHDKPIPQSKLNRGWYDLLRQFETQIYSGGRTLKDGSKIKLVSTGKSLSTEFPLHSLRVSLITSYAMDGKTPFPVISKLLAGHSRLIMTLYYNKITPAVMKKKMEESESLIDECEQESISAFLEDAELKQIRVSTAYLDERSVVSALANRNPLGWEKRHIGLCLVGGNTAEGGEPSNLAGCWNGGPPLNDKKNGPHSPVPHGPENCVRCRWFITDATYLDALRSHFNILSYKASQAAHIALELEHLKERIEDERFLAEIDDRPFTQFEEQKAAEKRYETQIVEADEYVKDMRDCFTLILRIVDAENNRTPGDDSQKLIAIGSDQDIHQPLSIIETESDLWQISEICMNAEIYPQLADDIRKTSAIEKRSRALNTALIRDGYAPIFMQMDDKMQLIIGNAFMRAMAKKVDPNNWQSDGLKLVSGFIETQQSLSSIGILNEAINAIKCKSGVSVMKLSDILNEVDQAKSGSEFKLL